MHGDADEVRPHAQGAALAKLTGGELVTLAGSGHAPIARSPVRVNLLLREFIGAPALPRDRLVRAPARPRRALYVSSPIGLGHAHRDVAIARELRRLHPDLEIDWLAQHPVTELLEARGERIHPASAELASESSHIQSEHADHDLDCFQALRRMDEVLLANFMVFHDVVAEEQYDVWIGDEAWDVDYYLHENPELKTAAYAWLTDFVGYLPMPDGGEREAHLTADYNAEMLEQIARFPRVRDRSIFIGDPDDIVSEHFGPGLPPIREWTEAHFLFSGYVTDFELLSDGERERWRAEFGYGPDDRVCIVTVGGSGVGLPLLQRVLDSWPEAKRLVPELRMVLVAGPRIDPAELATTDDVELLAGVADLHRHLAVCDLAIAHGGLATTMELTAHRRPFIYVPLKRHFEQNFHVRHRLERHRAGRRLEFDELTPTRLASAIAEELGRETDYREVPVDGAARAAAIIAELL
jgi:predicted glycosyltransferase